MESRDIPVERRDSTIDELVEHGVLYLQQTSNELICGCCGYAYPMLGYRVAVRNPFTWNHEFHDWGVVCWQCMAYAVMDGAVTTYRGRGTKWSF